MAERPVTFGRVPAPARLTRAIIDKPYAWDNLGPRQIKGVILHSTIGGELMTTEHYFADPSQAGYRRALTDFGVALKGYARQWNELVGYRAPWASGPYLAGGYDGIQFVERYGLNAINRDLASIEREARTYDVPVTPEQLATIVELTAWIIDRYARLPWHVWPRRPDGTAAIYYHWEFCGRGYKLCPGWQVEAHIDEIIDRVRDILHRYQTGEGLSPATWFDPHPSAFAPRALPPALERKTETINGHVWRDIPDRRVTVTAELAPRLRYATEKAPPVAAPMARGYTFVARFVVEGDEIAGSPYWWVTRAGSRIPMAYTTPRLDLEDVA